MDNTEPLRLTRSERGTLVADISDDQSLANWEKQLAQRLGIDSPHLAKSLLRQFIAASGLSRGSSLDEVNAALHLLVELKPQDMLELQLMIQMLSASRQSLELMGDGSKATVPEVRDLYLALSARLMRLYSKQLEALAKYRRKAQVIRIEKVTLENSQAVFGLTHGG